MRHNMRIMAKYRFLFVPGYRDDYTSAKDTDALEVAKEYFAVMKKVHPHIRYVSVWKYIGQCHYSLVGKYGN